MKNSLFPNALQVFNDLFNHYYEMHHQLSLFLNQIAHAPIDFQSILLKSESFNSYESSRKAAISERMWDLFFKAIKLDDFYKTQGENAASFLVDYRLDATSLTIACEFSRSNVDKFVRLYGINSPAFLADIKKEFSEIVKANWVADLSSGGAILQGIVFKGKMVSCEKNNGANIYSIDEDFKKLLIRLSVAAKHYAKEDFVLEDTIDQLSIKCPFYDFGFRLAAGIRVNIDERGCIFYAPNQINNFLEKDLTEEIIC